MCEKCLPPFRKWKECFSEADSAPEIISEIIPEDRYVHNEIADLKLQVAGILQTLSSFSPADSSSHSPVHHSTPVMSSTLINGTNQNYNDNNEESTEGTSSPKMYCSIGENETIAQPNTRQELSLFITNIDSCVTEADVKTMVCQCIGAPYNDCSRVVKLVSRHFKYGMLDNVSFRIDLNEKWREKALNASTWPCGVKFREFVNRAWKPSWKL